MHPGLSRPRLGQAFYLRDDSASQGPKRKTHRSFSPIFFSVHTRFGIWVWSLAFWEALVFLARGVGATVGGVGFVFKPRSAAWQRPVRTRHQSTLNCRPMATMICLRLERVVLGWVNTGSHLATGLYWDWYCTRRQAASTRTVRTRGLPCLLMAP